MKPCLTGKQKPAPAAVEMAPLIDMVFLLLIFYIVSASFSRGEAVPLERPQSRYAAAADPAAVTVALAKNGAVFVDGAPASGDCRAAVARALTASGVRRVVLCADRAVSAGLLLATADVCRAAGAEKVDLAAVKSVPGRGGN